MMTNQFFTRHVTYPNRILLLLLATCLMVGGVLITLNALFFHFTTIALFSTAWNLANLIIDICLCLLCLVMFFYGLYANQESPKTARFIWGLSALVMAYYANIVFVNGLQSTPFTPIDLWLAKLDLYLGVNTVSILAWLHHHPAIHHILTYAYDALVLELIIIPLCLVILTATKPLRILLNAQLSTMLIGGLIYYFFPTIAPAGIFHSPYFITLQHDTSLRFYEIHHHIKITTTQGGLIAFPSFHVIWAILLAFSTINKKWIFYPLCFLNSIIIASTVLLGWHYVADVIAGFLLAFLGIYFSTKHEYEDK